MTVLTNSLGQRTVYRHAIVGGEHRVLEVRGGGCSTCGETNVRYGYDKLGRLVETTRLNVDGEPIGAIYVPSRIEDFCWRIEQAERLLRRQVRGVTMSVT